MTCTCNTPQWTQTNTASGGLQTTTELDPTNHTSGTPKGRSLRQKTLLGENPPLGQPLHSITEEIRFTCIVTEPGGPSAPMRRPTAIKPQLKQGVHKSHKRHSRSWSSGDRNGYANECTKTSQDRTSTAAFMLWSRLSLTDRQSEGGSHPQTDQQQSGLITREGPT